MNTFDSRTFERFADFLEDRLASGQHLTEDSVRYSFFCAAQQASGIKQHEIVLELPHPAFKMKEIDTHILPANGRVAHFIEFKFHRASESSSPKPQKAGSLFKDFGRLSAVKNENNRCLVVYFTDKEMASYFAKHEEAYSGFWSKAVGSSFDFDDGFLAKTSDTVKNVCGEGHRAEVKIVFSSVLPGDFHLRVYEVIR